jgi:MFS family permease
MARNTSLMRVLTAYGLFILCEYLMWIAILVFAYDQGGATAAGLIVVVQLVPAALLAPVFAPLADRRSPVLLLAGGLLAQGVAAGATAALLLVDAWQLLVYLGAILHSVAVTTTRPGQAALLPSLAREVRELTGANAVIGWLEGVSVMLAGATSGIILAVGTVGHVCGFAALLLLVAAVLVVPLRRDVSSLQPGEARLDDVSGFTTLRREPTVRLLVGLLGAEYVVIGALDVLFVVLALDVLDAGEPWVGYLNMAYGAGGVALGAFAALLVGRTLGPVILGTALSLGAALALGAATVVPGVVVFLLVVVGGSRALFDVGARALLHRAVPEGQVARIFGVAEGLMMAGIAFGATIVPVLVALGGGALALVGVGALLPAVVLARAGRLRQVDRHAQVPVVEIALLRSLDLFHLLPPPVIEGLARSLEPQRLAAGSELFGEGDDGDCYWAIAEGEVHISRSGTRIATLRRGEGFGEIALLRTGRRTASAVAATPVLAYRLDRDPFLTAVTGHRPTLESALQGVHETQRRDARREESGQDEGGTPDS